MRSIALATLLLAAAACTTVRNPVTGRDERTVMDEAAELAEGKKAHPAVLAEYGELKNAKLQAYVNQVGQRLAKQSHRSNLEWHFTVLDSPQVNAFALPGGYVYITRGIMAYLGSEADLAGVLGHEIGHVTARHGAQRVTRQQTAGLGVLAATVLGAVLEGSGVAGAGSLASQVSQGVAAGYVARYSREQESQADRLGAEYLARTNADPRNMIDVTQLLVNQERFAADRAGAAGREPPKGTDWLSSHPSSEQRLSDMRTIAAQYKGHYADEGRARYLQAIDGITFGDGREQGVVRGRNFFHEPLGIALTAPVGWRIDNGGDALALLDPEGSAALVLKTVPPEAGATHEAIIRNAIKPDAGRTEQRSLNGQPATHFIGTRRNERGQSQNVVLTIVTGPQQRHFALLYLARDAAALQRQYRALQEAEASFRALSATDRAAARPWTIEMVTMPRGGFAELARSSPLGSHAQQQLRLLNAAYPSGDIAPGQLVKTVR
ncbi:MAG: M48 family metalloprotease [Nitrospira sp.]|nr:M48 family metalloprotease [Nitrospira sp.]